MTENVKTLVSDEQIENAWGNASFGNSDKRDVIANALLKYACGYSTGNTIFCICKKLRLVTKNENLTTLGKRYLYSEHAYKISV